MPPALSPCRRPYAAALLAIAALPGLAGPATGAAQEPVRIGLVVPAEGPAAEAGAAVLRGAERAIRRANEEGGLDGRPFELRVVTEEGLWGQGMSRIVALAFDGPVAGVVGGLDGRSAHLIQQVVTKARIPFVTPWATDFTLSRGMIPWFFQVVPDDRQQASAVVAAITTDTTPAPGAATIVVISDTTYDSRHFLAALRHAAAAAEVPVRALHPDDVLRDGGAPESPPSAVVVATGPGAAARVLVRLGSLRDPPPVYLPLRLTVDPVLARAAAYPGSALVPGMTVASGTDFAAAAGEDAVRALVVAVREAGVDHWRIRDALAEGSFTGATGPVAFDAAGRRTGNVRVVPVGSPGLGSTDVGSPDVSADSPRSPPARRP